MDWKDLGKSIIKYGAPLLGTVVGGPAGGVIGATLAATFGGDPEKPEELARKIADDPEASAKLLKIQTDAKVRLEELQFEQAKLEVQDKGSARQREVNLSKSGQKDWTPPILAILLTLGFFSTLWALFFINIPKEIIGLVEVMLGSIGAAWLMSISYYFGSSFGSRQKDKLTK